jgi:cold shock CspA family protein
MTLAGTISRIDRLHQYGEIQGDDGKVRLFDRENMVRWLQFNELAPGTRVSYEVENTGGVINVERID